MSKLSITIHPEMKVISVKENDQLLDSLRNSWIEIESPCGGKGICGKCKVEVIKGLVNKPTTEEIGFLTRQELAQGIRLACLVKPLSDLTIRLLGSDEKKHRILTDGYRPEILINPVISKKVFKLKRPTLKNTLSYQEILEGVLDNALPSSGPDFLRELSNIFEGDTVTVVFSDEIPIGLEGGDTSQELYGIAVDIGTTTVVVSLVDLLSGREIGSETAINPQKDFGLDVLSRIDFAMKQHNGAIILQKVIVDCLNQLFARLCSKTGIRQNRVYEIAVAANATMMHLLMGVNPKSIGKAPYATVFTGSQYFPAKDLGLNASPFARVYCLPGVSGYIGADIVAGTVVAKLNEVKGNVLFMDIGTNGELVLSKSGELSACSCAAGPALEGMNISCGMRAAEGAIEGVEFGPSGVELKIIGNTEPTGICGSGILDAVAEISRTGLMERSGRFKKKADLEKGIDGRKLTHLLWEEGGKRKIVLAEGTGPITITQGDIRQVQLAKGAILSGFYALLDLIGIDIKDLDEVIIAGQFGAHLKVDSLIGVGLVPENLRKKVRYIGNSSKTGALICLLSKEARKEMEKTAKKVRYFELSTKPGYEGLFAQCLSF
ncbi:MAG: ASKHA domain-containing protein [Syntrophomonadaceae bacterium]|nr:ASKHA domain-containing protein [Syntrophomonadaceae bacterium]